MLGTLGNFLDSQVFPHVMAFHAEWKLKSELDKLRTSTFTIDKDTKIGKALVEALKHDHEEELERRNRIVEKARSGLFIIGVTIVIMLTSLQFLGEYKQAANLFNLVVLIAAVVSFVLSAITLTMAVNIRQRHSVFLDDLVKASDDGELAVVKMTRHDWVRDLYHAGKCNQKTTTIISNYVDVSFVGIRNGIIFLAVFFVSALFSV